MSKICFKCGKSYPDEMIRPKYNFVGKKVGAQCVNCIANKPVSMYGRPPAVVAEGVCTTPESRLPKIQD